MDYICHRAYTDGYKEVKKGDGLTVEKTTLGTVLHHNGNFICTAHSFISTLHFALDTDGHGLERGATTYAIAYAPRNVGKGSRFTDGERELICGKWQRYIRPECDTVIFNDNFFAAPIEDLRQMAADLHIEAEQ